MKLVACAEFEDKQGDSRGEHGEKVGDQECPPAVFIRHVWKSPDVAEADGRPRSGGDDADKLLGGTGNDLLLGDRIVERYPTKASALMPCI